MKAILTLSGAIAITGLGLGAESASKAPADPSPDMAAVQANDRAYEEAYAKGDVEALAKFFTDDVQYTADDGRSFDGNEAIKSCLKHALRENEGAKLSIDIASVKRLTPDVVVEKGSTKVVTKAGEEMGSLYTAVHVKRGGQWKISQLIETPVPEAAPADHLAELAWLVGNWEEADKDAGVTIASHYQWARGGNFLTRNVTVKRGDDPVLEGWQIIGWDPVAESIRSWTYDGEGGFSDGLWTREGERWLVRESGYTPDGGRTSAEQTITKSGEDRFSWESGNRTLDGDPRPGVGRIEIRRVKKGE